MRTVKCLAIATAALWFLPALHAADADVSEKFYDAIRAGDNAAVQRLLKGGADVNVRDSRGATPLMYAAAVGTPAMMRRLIEAGADVNARTSFDATALMWGATDIQKVRLLVDKGADVNARSKRGQTALAIAAASSGTADVVKLLLAKGASAGAPPAQPAGRTAGGDSAERRGRMVAASPVLLAAGVNDGQNVKALLARGPAADPPSPGGFTPLMFAAAHGNAPMVKSLLAKGADVNAQSMPSFGPPVKNGPIALGHLSPLMLAATSGSPETVRLLLSAGADVNARDVRGMTPLMLAVATDHPNQEIVRMLLDKRPDAAARSKAGETAFEWAAKFRNPAVLPAIAGVSPAAERPVVVPASAARAGETDVRAAAEKSIALLQSSAATFLKNGGCISCHSHNITTMAAAVARAKGVSFDEKAAGEMSRGTRLQFAAFADGLLERLDPPAVEILSWALTALSFDGAEPNRVTDAMVRNLASQQMSDGSWHFPGIQRPPTSDGGFTTTALSVRAIRHYTPPALKAEMDRRVARAVAWLINRPASTTEDAVMQLLGATWGGAEHAVVERLAEKVQALQHEDGGWAQTPYLKSDAYATGTALYALHESGRPAAGSPAYQKGVRFLLDTQAEDGSWHVASRAPKFQPYFDGGFPYEHDQWISQWATGWAAIALSHAIPERVALR